MQTGRNIMGIYNDFSSKLTKKVTLVENSINVCLINERQHV